MSNRRNPRASSRASLASTALGLALMAVIFGIQPCAAMAAPDAASTAVADPAPAPVTLVPSTPEIFSPPSPPRAPLPVYSPGGTPARVFPTAPPSASGSAAAPASGPAPAPDDDIRDIRGPKSIFPLWRLLAWIAIAALAAIGGYFGWRRTRRPPAPRLLEFFEIALQRLEGIRPLMQPATVREFSIAISDVVRQYIEAQMKITATHRTTEEFLHDLLDSSNAALAAHRNLLAEFLQACDMAKFAGVGLSMRIMESLHQSARGFVIETSKPVAAPAPARAPQPVPAAQV
ncbi:MAG: hypothetical protein WA803_06305 [Steroidobacteraceae bacterium]